MKIKEENFANIGNSVDVLEQMYNIHIDLERIEELLSTSEDSDNNDDDNRNYGQGGDVNIDGGGHLDAAMEMVEMNQTANEPMAPIAISDNNRNPVIQAVSGSDADLVGSIGT
jgi:hypothetical protein